MKCASGLGQILLEKKKEQRSLNSRNILELPPSLCCPAQDKTITIDQAVAYQQYLISAGLIVCGIMTAIQVTGIPLPSFPGFRNRQWGAGILSVMGISFTTYPIASQCLANECDTRTNNGNACGRSGPMSVGAAVQMPQEQG